MKRAFRIVLVSSVLLSCGGSNDTSVHDITPETFLKFFTGLNLPVNVADTGLKRFGDTMTINYGVFTRFVPDSVLQYFLGKQAGKYAIHPAGSVHAKEGDYLLAKFALDKAIKLAVFLMDENHNYVSSLQLLDNYDNDKYSHSVSITSEPTFITRQEKLGNDNELLYSKHGYAFSETTNSFAEVMNDSNEDLKKNSEIINPIDTLASTNKFSGDYSADKKNFISVRDGKDALTYNFFIHFEKNNGDCTGELKGKMSLTDENNAVYQESGDPCEIRFRFSGSSIKVTEQGNCGNHRGITCPYDFTFRKKKSPKTK